MAIRFSAIRLTALSVVIGTLALAACSQPKPVTTSPSTPAVSSATTLTLENAANKEQLNEAFRQIMSKYYPELKNQNPMTQIKGCDYLILANNVLSSSPVMFCNFEPSFDSWNSPTVIRQFAEAGKAGNLIQIKTLADLKSTTLVKDQKTVIPGTKVVVQTTEWNIYQVTADSLVEIATSKLEYLNGLTNNPDGSNIVDNKQMILRTGETFRVYTPIQTSIANLASSFVQEEQVVNLTPVTLTPLKKSN